MKNKGFTLIELMIVVAIIGILAAIAIPAYQDYTIRAQIAEGINLTNAVKPKIQEYYKQHGRFPSDNQDAGLPQAQYLIGNYVKGVEVIEGAIHVTYGHKVNRLVTDKVLTIRPQFVRQSAITPLAWLCGGDQVVSGMEVAGENRTDLGPQFLPAVCR